MELHALKWTVRVFNSTYIVLHEFCVDLRELSWICLHFSWIYVDLPGFTAFFVDLRGLHARMKQESSKGDRTEPCVYSTDDSDLTPFLLCFSSTRILDVTGGGLVTVLASQVRIGQLPVPTSNLCLLPL